MAYTDGIDKIYRNNVAGIEKTEVFKQARKAGFDAVTFNGQIYVMTSTNTWVLTPFTLDDFKC